MLNIYSVLYSYHKTKYGGTPHQIGQQHDVIAAANGLPATLDAVLTADGTGGRATPTGYVRVFDAIANHGVGAVLS